MTKPRSSHFVTALLVAGAVAFGMVLAGGLSLTPQGSTAPQDLVDLPVPPAGDTLPTQNGLPGFADLAARVSPAVAAIEVTAFESRRPQRRGGRVDPFEFFFGPRGRGQQDENEDESEDREFRNESGGSGFVISPDGLVITNNHVVRDADRVQVSLGDKEFPAEVKGLDPATDLALLKIEADYDLPYLALGDSEALRVGDWVMAIGNPAQLANTVTVGVVSAKQRRINISAETTSFENFIQTDAAINFGNSGGPLVNLRGEVVGINTAINFGSENIGFAVPVDTLRGVLPHLRKDGRVRRGFLGIGVEDLDSESAEAFGLDSSDGVIVTQVQPEQPADEAGIEPEDVILGVDGRKVGNVRELIDYVSSAGPDAKVELDVYRGGKTLKKMVQLAERPTGDSEAEPEEEEESSGIEWLGIRYQDLTPGMRETHGLPADLDGVWVTEISPRSPLADENVVTNGRLINVITRLNGAPVANVEEFEALIRKARPGSRLRLYIRRFADGQDFPQLVFPRVPAE